MAFELISTTTVSAGGAASIDFTSIPQTYKDLQIVFSGRTNAAVVSSAILFSFNGSTTGFTNRFLYGSGSGVVSSTSLDRYAASANGASATSNTFSNASIYIPNYAGSTNKSWSTDTVLENNATEAYQLINAGLWSNTAAITSISLTPSSGSFVQYSQASLYGVSTTGATGATVS